MTEPKIGVATDPNGPLVGPTPSYDVPFIIKRGDELPTMGGELTVGKSAISGGGGRQTHMYKPARACQNFWTAPVKEDIPEHWNYNMGLKSMRTCLACDHVGILKVDHRGLGSRERMESLRMGPR